jgi:hypothetical protein
VGNDDAKLFRRHTVPQSPWQGNVCENANITIKMTRNTLPGWLTDLYSDFGQMAVAVIRYMELTLALPNE